MLKIVAYGTGALCLLTSAVKAGTCEVISASGTGLTKAAATTLSTEALATLIAGKSLKAEGDIQTACKPIMVMTECQSTQRACK